VHLDRRELLKGAVAVAGVGVLADFRASVTAAPAETSPARRPFDVVDVNVSLFQWPFRRLPLDTLDAMAAKLRSLEIQQAWAGSYEGILQRDLRGVNARLAEACSSVPGKQLVPFGSVNPTLPDWEDDVRRCHEVHRMPGIRLHPNYHGYTLDEPRFAKLLSIASERGLLVQLAVTMEDTRTQHVQMLVPDVDLSPLPDLTAKFPAARVMLLNAKPRPAVVQRLALSPNITFDIARVEATDGIARLIDAVTPERVMFGTHAPFLIYEAALIKLYESQLSEPQVRSLLSKNARQLVSHA
jgi:predicted TIM-barrel fold metal-dependent hydrolase